MIKIKSARCKYCCKTLVGPCANSHAANACENAHPDVLYQDRQQHKAQFRQLLRNIGRAQRKGEAR